MNNGFNVHSLPFLFTSLLFFVFPLLVLLKNKKSAVARSFFILGLSASVWQFPYFIGYNLTNTATIFVWYRVAYFALAFVSSATYHFIVSFLGLNRKRFISLFYIISFVFSILVIKSQYIIKGIQEFSWGSCSVPGSAYAIFLLLLVTPFLLSVLCLYQEYRQAESPHKRKRIKYFLITLPIAYLALIDSFSIHGLQIYPFGFIPLIFFGASTTYAIIRYRLLDIEIIIKRASLIVSGFIISVSVIYICAWYLQPYFYASLGKNWVLFPTSVSLIVGFGLFNFINFVRHMQETELSRKFSYRPILKREAVRVSTAKSTKELITYLIRDLSSWVRLDYVGIFILDPQNKRFLLARDFSRQEKAKKLPLSMPLPQDNPLITSLLKKRKPLIRSELKYYLDTDTVSLEKKKSLKDLVEELERLNAEISIPCFCEGKLISIINMGHKLNLDEIITTEDLEIFTSLSNTIARTLHDFMLEKEKRRLIVASQNTIISAIEAKDSYTRGHTDRVAGYTAIIGEQMGRFLRNSPRDLYNLNWSAQLHDVGKIGIPDSILLKPGPLNEQEWKKIKEHPLSGIKIVSPVQEWLGEDILTGILHHHENLDGSGYPSGLKGEEIHMFARIIRVADAFDAMTSNRPYRSALTEKAAFSELLKYKGIYFDPVVVEVWQNLHY